MALLTGRREELRRASPRHAEAFEREPCVVGQLACLVGATHDVPADVLEVLPELASEQTWEADRFHRVGARVADRIVSEFGRRWGDLLARPDLRAAVDSGALSWTQLASKVERGIRESPALARLEASPRGGIVLQDLWREVERAYEEATTTAAANPPAAATERQASTGSSAVHPSDGARAIREADGQERARKIAAAYRDGRPPGCRREMPHWTDPDAASGVFWDGVGEVIDLKQHAARRALGAVCHPDGKPVYVAGKHGNGGSPTASAARGRRLSACWSGTKRSHTKSSESQRRDMRSS